MIALTDFRNRLAKNAKHNAKWAKRVGTEAYRVYDCDVPQVPVAIDIYGSRVHIAEFDTAWQQTDAEHAAWVQAVRDVVQQTLSISEQISFKVRRRQRGTAQYEKMGVAGESLIVSEHGRRFEVNLDSYLDTGLFLDHRPLRQRVAKMALNKRFLNLFAYTGSFTVYAAAGGASESLTVDLSNTYLDWAGRNFALNGLDASKHQRLRADVLQYLEAAVTGAQSNPRAQFDLIVLDPPSFSNSAKMQEVLDIQRDHSRLIGQCRKLLSPGGTLFFSTNLRGFKLDKGWEADCRDISAQSVPEDFRDRKIHQCFEFGSR